jgi:hypothetical protein
MNAFSNIDVGAAATWHAAGVSRAQLAKLVRTGELVPLRYGIYAKAALVAAAETDLALGHALQVAGVTARKRDGVASHHSAARLWGLRLLNKPPAGMVTLTVPPGTRSGAYRRGTVIRHAAELPAEHMTKLYGMPATTAARNRHRHRPR